MRGTSGDCEPRVHVHGRKLGSDAGGPADGDEDARIVDGGGARGLGCDAGEDPGGSEAVFDQAYVAAAVDYAGDIGGLRRTQVAIVKRSLTVAAPANGAGSGGVEKSL